MADCALRGRQGGMQSKIFVYLSAARRMNVAAQQ